MKPLAKGLLAGCVVLIVLAGIGVLLGVRWVNANKGRLRAQAEQVRTEGQQFGRTATTSACVAKAMENYRTDTSLLGEARSRIWLGACLDSSTPEDAFCAGIPPGRDHAYRTRRLSDAHHRPRRDKGCTSSWRSAAVLRAPREAVVDGDFGRQRVEPRRSQRPRAHLWPLRKPLCATWVQTLLVLPFSEGPHAYGFLANRSRAHSINRTVDSSADALYRVARLNRAYRCHLLNAMSVRCGSSDRTTERPPFRFAPVISPFAIDLSRAAIARSAI
jgi:hypothetical protein